MDAEELAKEHATIADVVTADKVDAVSSHIVTDGESRTLSVLTEKRGALGARPSRQRGVRARPTHVGKAAGAKRAAGAAQESRARAASPATEAERTRGLRPAAAADDTPTPDGKALRVRQLAMREAVSELDDADELKGSQEVYDAGRAAKRAASYARSKRKGDAAAATGRTHEGAKRAGALNAKKSGAANAKARAGTRAQAAQHAATRHAAPQATGAAMGRAAASSGSAGVAGAVGGSSAAVAGGVVCGIVAFVLASLVIGQVISALFGFWDAEDKRRSMEGLPPYVTYEMVEEAIRCQEEYGHPAGCTIAQIIAESGQGDSMSQLATRDHNLFGMKWATSFASAPEVAGKAGWSTQEEYAPGQTTTVTAYFTVFKGDVECIRFRSRVFLQASRYRNNALIAEAMAEGSSDKMAEGLKDAGWATSSGYVDALKSIMDAYGLRRFDSMSVEDLEGGALARDAIVNAAYGQLGVPYVWGGTTPGVGLDCSGLTQYCYRQAGISIPRNSEDQAAHGTKIPVSQARPGDILWRPGHVAVYIGGDNYIHEPHSGAVCTIASGTSYFASAIKIR